jgi:hypothetical protein
MKNSAYEGITYILLYVRVAITVFQKPTYYSHITRPLGDDAKPGD